jgi:hypothetical protein
MGLTALRRPERLAGAYLIVTALSGMLSGIAAASQSTSGWQPVLLDQWLTAVEQHVPGESDSSLLSAATWSGNDLRQLWNDVQVLLLIVENPRLSRFRVRLREYETTAAQRGTPTFTFDRGQRAALDALADRVRTAGLNVVLRRAILLHTDLVTLAPDLVASSAGAAPARAPVRMLVGDGNSRGVESMSLHWEMARLLAASVTPDPRADLWIRDWYRATVALVQHAQSFDSVQLRHGLRLFPRDPQLLLLAGCEREAFASPLFQAFARSVRNPFLRVPFGSAGAELEVAERYYRQALEVDSEFAEARLRLGRVLGLRGRHTEAVTELTRVLQGSAEAPLEYFARLFLGAEHEVLGALEPARAAYAMAAELTSGARIPHLAVARVARELGDTVTMQESLQRALAPEADDESTDPWWQYHGMQGRLAESWLTRLRQDWRPQAP